MTTKRCVMCGKDMVGEDEFTETCYHCQDKSMENFSLMSTNLNTMLLELEDNTEISEHKKQIRKVAVFEAIKLFGDTPEIEVNGADEYLDDTSVLIDALNEMLHELEMLAISELTAWKIYSVVNAIKEYGGTPELEFYKSKHGSEITI